MSDDPVIYEYCNFINIVTLIFAKILQREAILLCLLCLK